MLKIDGIGIKGIEEIERTLSVLGYQLSSGNEIDIQDCFTKDINLEQ